MLNNILLEIPILGSAFYDYNDFGEMLIRFLLNFIVAFIVIRVIYYPIHKRKDLLFTYFLLTFYLLFI
jgi:undecaprenyl pyrophosphate phosphatase UppP